MKINKYKTDNHIVLSLDGMLDTSSSEAFRAQTAQILSSTENEAVTIDMTNLEYISSKGLRDVLGLIKKMKENGRSLNFKGIRPAVREIFDLSGLSAIMTII